VYVKDSEEQAAIRAEIAELKQLHRDLDDTIIELEEGVFKEPLRLRRLKKQKLQIKDRLARLESSLIPDLDA